MSSVPRPQRPRPRGLSRHQLHEDSTDSEVSASRTSTCTGIRTNYTVACTAQGHWSHTHCTLRCVCYSHQWERLIDYTKGHNVDIRSQFTVNKWSASAAHGVASVCTVLSVRLSVARQSRRRCVSRDNSEVSPFIPYITVHRPCVYISKGSFCVALWVASL